MTRVFLIAALVGSLVAVPGATAANPPPGKIVWAKDYPKAIDAKPGDKMGAVELYGTYEPMPGWALKKGYLQYHRRTGGVLVESEEIKFANGKWGGVDPKDNTKIVPLRVTMDQGEWSLRAVFHVEGKDDAGNTVTIPYLATIEHVTVK